MKKEKRKTQSILDGFLADFVLTRRSFMKKASAATGTAVALGGLQPSLRALAASGEVGSGPWSRVWSFIKQLLEELSEVPLAWLSRAAP